MFKLIQDLRFVVGTFFAILGLILISVGYCNPVASTIDGENMNLFAGWTMLVFAGFMISWSLFCSHKEG